MNILPADFFTETRLLTDGGFISERGNAGDFNYYSFEVTDTRVSYSFKAIARGQSLVQVYLRYNGLPTPLFYDSRSHRSSNSILILTPSHKGKSLTHFNGGF